MGENISFPAVTGPLTGFRLASPCCSHKYTEITHIFQLLIISYYFYIILTINKGSIMLNLRANVANQCAGNSENTSLKSASRKSRWAEDKHHFRTS